MAVVSGWNPPSLPPWSRSRSELSTGEGVGVHHPRLSARRRHYLPRCIHHAVTRPNSKHRIMTSIDPFADSRVLPLPPLSPASPFRPPPAEEEAVKRPIPTAAVMA